MSAVQLPSLNITEILQAINSDVVEEQEKGCRAARYVLMGVNAALFLFRESYITNNFVSLLCFFKVGFSFLSVLTLYSSRLT